MWESCPVDDYQAQPDYMHGWRWEDPRWREWTGADPAKLVLEAIRRAVDIQDANARRIQLSVRPLMLVDVLNALGDSLRVAGSDIWDGSDLWNDPRFGEGYDEAAFRERHKHGEG